jgi:hypothetical protein
MSSGQFRNQGGFSGIWKTDYAYISQTFKNKADFFCFPLRPGLRKPRLSINGGFKKGISFPAPAALQNYKFFPVFCQVGYYFVRVIIYYRRSHWNI